MVMVPEGTGLKMMRDASEFVEMYRAIGDASTDRERADANSAFTRWVSGVDQEVLLHAMFGMAVLIYNLIDDDRLQAFLLTAEVELPDGL